MTVEAGFIHRLIGGGRAKPPVPVPAESELEQIAFAVPPRVGAEYLTTALLVDLWHRIDAAFDVELAVANLTVQEFLKPKLTRRLCDKSLILLVAEAGLEPATFGL